MRGKNFLNKLIVAVVSVGSLIVTPAILNLDAGKFSVSVARAEIQNYTARDTSMFDFGENDKYIVNAVKKMVPKITLSKTVIIFGTTFFIIGSSEGFAG